MIDASIFPKVPSGNTNAPVIMAGEKGADLVKQYWYGYSKRRRRSTTSDEYKINWPQKLAKSSSIGPKDHEILDDAAEDYSEAEEEEVKFEVKVDLPPDASEFREQSENGGKVEVKTEI